MTQNSPKLFNIFRKSIFFYLQHFLRILEILSWIIIPGSVIFVLFFFWGLKEVQLYALMTIFFLSIPFLLVLLSLAILKLIDALNHQADSSSLTIYSQAFSVYMGSFLVIFLVFVKVSLWTLLMIVPGFLFSIYYSFSFMAYVLEGKKGMQALAFSKDLIQPNFLKFFVFAGFLLIVMLPLFLSALFMSNYVYGLSLLTNMSIIMAAVSTVNLLWGILIVFPIVFLYFVYQDFILCSRKK